MLITFALGIPLTFVAAMVNKNGFFHEKTVSVRPSNGQLMAYIAGRRHAWSLPVRAAAAHARPERRPTRPPTPTSSEPIE